MLIGTGIAAALVGIGADSRLERLSCALAVSTNVIAGVHYWLLIQKEEEGGQGQNEKRLYKYDIRHRDWFLTLPFMCIDLYSLRKEVSDIREENLTTPNLTRWGSCALLCGMVALGWWSTRLSSSKLNSPMPRVVAFSLACVFFGLVVNDLLAPIVHARGSSRDAILVLTLVWVAYPVVTLLSLMKQKNQTEGDKCIWLEDVLFSSLDVTSKGGLAMYVVLRGT